MNEKTLRVLEYNKICALLKDQARSQMGKDKISDLGPSLEEHEIRHMLTETTEAVSVILKKGTIPLGSLYDVIGPVQYAVKGGTLTMGQLLQIGHNLQVSRNVQQFLHSDLPQLPIIHGLSEVISIQRNLEEEIERSIESEDEMADNASSQLRTIRRKIALQNESIRSKMNQILTSGENKTLLQDGIVTLRQGRYVIPVKQEHRNRFPGIIHDQSSTGATLFIEPQVIVDMNNALRDLEIEEKKEMERILAALSADVADVGEELRNNQRILVDLDVIFAKGKLSCKMKGEGPDIIQDDLLKIVNGRHPLIDPQDVIPITVSIGKEFNALIITGPNTGGKTVTLKTIGLFVLMAQSGLHIPADPGTQIPVFRKVFADIGDEQSIEQSLSTFSSHMSNIIQIIQEADHESLVLLDELGAGTDPTEGAALAIAILDELYRRKTKTFATTHYTELKKYAIATPGVQNASMEFDVETLSPTYRLSIGIPGRSNAFEIAGKLGLPDALIQYAKGLLQREDIAFEDVISGVEEDKKRAEEDRDAAMALHLETQAQKRDLEKKQEKFAEQKERILAAAKEEAREIVRDVKEFSDQIQKELRDLEKKSDSSERNRTAESIRQRIREKQSGFVQELPRVENPDPVDPSQLDVGSFVRILSLDKKGEILGIDREKGDVLVQVGLMKINVGIDQVVKIKSKEMKRDREKSRYGSMYRSKSQSVGTTVNVVGKNLDEAMMDVDKYLDDAFMAGLEEVTVIHGRGAGILREGLADQFRHHKHVKTFRKGAYNEGGDGVTIVELK